jgi:hypothetical protein
LTFHSGHVDILHCFFVKSSNIALLFSTISGWMILVKP